MSKQPSNEQNIPLKFAPGDYEGKWQEFWEEKKVYKTLDINQTRNSKLETRNNNLKNSNFLNSNVSDFEFRTSNFSKAYILDMFPYPSAAGLHVGHPEGYTATDIVARYKRMKGEAVLHPMGWDAFGLPAENFAIKQGVHPSETTKKSIENFKRQIMALGFSYDWDKELSTCDAEYYQFTQWLFEFLYRRGLAYHKFAPANWCASCQTVLANEQVVDGKCERCHNLVIQKEIEQWFFKITDFAERLINDLDKIDWPESTKTGQRNWIGKSEGVRIKFQIQNPNFQKENNQDPKKEISNFKFQISNSDEKFVSVFTTRPDTLFGVTYLVLAPEHPAVLELADLEHMPQVQEYQRKSSLKSNLQRISLEKKKTGVFTGAYVRHPLTQKSIPVYVADYIVASYGTGAIMGVPAHDERDYDFAREMGLPIEVVCIDKMSYQRLTKEFAGKDTEKDFSEKPQNLRGIINANDKNQFPQSTENEKFPKEVLIEQLSSIGFKLPYLGYGVTINSGKYDGMETVENIANISKDIKQNGWGEKTVNFKLRDWLISRQRYWGSPIPIIYCEKCRESSKSKIQISKANLENYYSNAPGEYLVPENELPVLLPTDVDFRPTGESPLVRSQSFHEVKCPKCGAKARRESDTMDTFVCSSWYYFAFPWWEKYRAENLKFEIRNLKSIGENSNYIKIDSLFEKYRQEINSWLPVDLYVGGAEHTVLHLLYSRFVTKALFDAKLLDFDEPFMKLRHVGMILGLDGQKMSKSRGNVINPDEIVKAYGADTMRLYEMFMGPLSDKKPWDEHGVEGCYRFLRRVYHLISTTDKEKLACSNVKLWQITQQLLKDVEGDIMAMKFNTGIAKMMTWLNEASDEISNFQFQISKQNLNFKFQISDSFKVFLLILAPFAPHLAEELWFRLLSVDDLKNYRSIHLESWPEVDEKALKTEKTLIFLVEISGKVVEKILFQENDERYQKQTKVEEIVFKLDKVISKLQSQISKQGEDPSVSKKPQDDANVNWKFCKVIFIPKKLINFVV
jgi:leucyl-tRNA synthetase